MGQIALAVGGAVVGGTIGFMVGGPAGAVMGAQIGFTVGYAVGGLFFAPGVPAQKGPRLNDLTTTTSTYGVPIPKIWGVYRLGGNVIYSTPIEEHKHTKTQNGQKSVTYTYTANCSIAFCQNAVTDYLNIYADSKLIYGVSPDSGKFVNKYKGVMTFYYGDETQLPSPLQQVGPGVGPTLVPGYRGIAYIDFKDLPLTDFGNRIPNIEAIIQVNGPPQTVVETDAAMLVDWRLASEGGISDTFRTDYLAVDFPNSWMYLIGTSSGVANYIRSIDMDGMIEDNQKILPGSLHFNTVGPFVCAYDGSLFFMAGLQAPFVRLDPQPGAILDQFTGTVGAPPYFTDTVWMSVYDAAPMRIDIQDYLLCACNDTTQIGILQLNTDGTMQNAWASAVDPSYNQMSCYKGRVGASSCEGWMIGPTAGGSPVQLDVWNLFYTGTGAPSVTKVATVALANSASAWHAVYDAGQDALLFVTTAPTSTDNGVSFAKITRAAGVVAQATVVPATAGIAMMSNSGGIEASRITKGVFRWGKSAHVYSLDTVNLTLLSDKTDFVADAASGSLSGHAVANITNEMTYDGDADWLWLMATIASDPNNRLYMIKTPHRETVTGAVPADGSVTLDAIVGDLCIASTKLAAPDIDVARLASQRVQGFGVLNGSSCRDAIDSLRQVFFFDGVETEGRLKFDFWDKLDSGFVSRQDLGARNGGGSDQAVVKVSEIRLQEAELPKKVVLRYPNIDNSLLPNAQYAARVSEAVNATAETVVETAVVFNDDEALGRCEVMLYVLWTRRNGYEITLPRSYIGIDPGDVVNLPLDDAGTAVQPVYVTQADLGADGLYKVTGQSHDETAYVSSGLPGVGNRIITVQDPDSGTVQVVLIDGPLLDPDSDRPGLYAAAWGATSAWRGGTLYESVDDVSFAEVASWNGPAVVGTLVVAPSAAPMSNAIDPDAFLYVTLATGETLPSATEHMVLSGQNRALLGSQATGWEIVGFLDATQVDAATNKWKLLGLIRGVDGTEWRASHAVGELFVLLDGAGVQSVDHAFPLAGVTRYYRGTDSGLALDVATSIPFGCQDVRITPLAPTLVAGTRDGSLNLTVTWVRRARSDGTWGDLDDPPLDEQSERYFVEIYNGLTIVRTATVTAPTLSYLASQQVTDFGSAQPSVSIVVYQLSARLGRGRGAAATV